MNFREIFINHHPELREKYDSEQYSLAQKIIGKKLSLKVNQPTLASLMEVSYDKYLDMESGSIDIPVKDYEIALKKVANLTKTELDSELIDSISQFPSYVVKRAKESVKKKWLFNNQHETLNDLNLNFVKDKSIKKSLKESIVYRKKIQIEPLDSVSQELNESNVLVSKMANKLNRQEIETDDKYSFELEEKQFGKISLSA